MLNLSSTSSLLCIESPMTDSANRNGIARWIVLALPGIMLLDHLATGIVTSWLAGVPMLQALSHFDSNWYNSIVANGYTEQSLAFFPLYPALLKLIQSVTSQLLPTQITGVVFSTVLFAVFCILTATISDDAKWQEGLLAPRTVSGWFCFVYGPASYVLHSNHTEALFLLLSLAAFAASKSGRWIWAALFAGLCADVCHTQHRHADS